MALKKQELSYDNTGKKPVFRLKNTFNFSDEIEAISDIQKNGKSKSQDGTMSYMGTIPNSLFLVDPWLKEAMKARNAGDMGEYQRLIRTFFKLNPKLANPYNKTLFTGA